MKTNGIIFSSAVILITAFFLPFTVFAASEDKGCDPKIRQECCCKIDQTLKSLESLQTKLEKLKAEIEQGKQMDQMEAEKYLKRLNNVEDFVTNTEGGGW